jgi:hypothetical protein
MFGICSLASRASDALPLSGTSASFCGTMGCSTSTAPPSDESPGVLACARSDGADIRADVRRDRRAAPPANRQPRRNRNPISTTHSVTEIKKNRNGSVSLAANQFSYALRVGQTDSDRES